jgi:GntP family gluconate:H+ symporter
MTPIFLLLAGMAIVLGGVLLLRLHPFIALIIGALCIALLTPEAALESFAQSNLESGDFTEKAAEKFAGQNAASRVASAFGEGCGKVGLLIAMAAIIGKCLLDSGSAQRIVQAILAVFGVARAHLAFLLSSFLLAIPVFFDTVFYLLIPIGKAMRRRTGKNYVLYILTIVAGGTMAHSLVPPTPGPLLVAGELGVDLGVMIIGGLCVGIVSVGFGYAYSVWANKRWEIPLRDEAGEESEQEVVDQPMPPVWAAFLPILLPIILIGIATYTKSTPSSPAWLKSLAYLGDKNLALILSAAVAMVVLAVMKRGQRDALATASKSAIASGANIILITAAGAAFGGVLHQTGIAGAIAAMGGGAAGLMGLPSVFLITMLVRTAQGSATVAMITAAPIAKAFLDAGDLGFHPVYLALAIGCGSKPIPWMNDSGFWVITKMTGMKESETLRIVTPMMSLMGVVGLIATIVGALIFPLVSE